MNLRYFAKTEAESNSGKQYQSIEPVSETKPAVLQFPIIPQLILFINLYFLGD
jgi:hypothetical protein